ncbi:MAG: UDP-2,3-diacylglucosamine diphosphatase [Betaproteobacteria bacterium]|nr:UDP-2,3-diacylglucosamine diphosphatase [Betaproteobacteria bacterium]
MPRTLFISDLHLSEGRPAASERFQRFLGEQAAYAAALYVLGDLFDYWIGDDELAADDGTLARRVAAALGELARAGTAVHVMHGNRDFLLGDAFFAAARATALPDPSIATVDGVATLLTHGDTLCTDDAAYRRFRAEVRDRGWQERFLGLTLAERRTRALALRAASERDKRAKPPEIMDVNAAALREALERHRVTRLIHGHTHRPGRHELEVAGRRCERWVLPDWYEGGGYLVAEGGALRLVML